jgi:hypothetical protein
MFCVSLNENAYGFLVILSRESEYCCQQRQAGGLHNVHWLHFCAVRQEFLNSTNIHLGFSFGVALKKELYI